MNTDDCIIVSLLLIISIGVAIDRIEHYFWAKKINNMKARLYKKDPCQVKDDIQ